MWYAFIIYNYGFGWPCIFCIKLFNSIFWVVIMWFDFNFVIILFLSLVFFLWKLSGFKPLILDYDARFVCIPNNMKQYNAIWMINIDEDCTFMVLTNCSCHTILVRCKYEHVLSVQACVIALHNSMLYLKLSFFVH